MPDRLLNIEDVKKIVGCSHQTIYLMVREGRFPRGRKIGPRITRWLASEIDDFLEDLPRMGQER